VVDQVSHWKHRRKVPSALSGFATNSVRAAADRTGSPDELCLAEGHALEGILLPATDALAFMRKEVKLRHATCSLSLYVREL
jgi:hypothetical protein